MSANNPIQTIFIGHNKLDDTTMIAIMRSRTSYEYEVDSYRRAACLMKNLLGSFDDLNVSPSSKLEVVKIRMTPKGLSVWLQPRQPAKLEKAKYRLVIYDEKLSPVGVEEFDSYGLAKQRAANLNKLDYHHELYTRNERTGAYEKLVQPQF